MGRAALAMLSPGTIDVCTTTLQASLQSLLLASRRISRWAQWRQASVPYCLPRNVHRTAVCRCARKCITVHTVSVGEGPNRHRVEFGHRNVFFCAALCANVAFSPRSLHIRGCSVGASQHSDFLHHSIQPTRYRYSLLFKLQDFAFQVWLEVYTMP
jgi:hypothetical protein